MRKIILAAAMAALLSGGSAAIAAPKAATKPAPKPARLDLNNPVDALAAARKMQCSMKDGDTYVYHWAGRIYSRVPGEPDRHLFNMEGMNVRTCVTIKDPVKGDGYRLVSRELLFYMDPKTGEVLRNWTNPWTGKTVEVFHIANDPVNSRPTFPVDDAGKPFKLGGRVENGRVFMPIEVPLFYTNPLAGDYQDYVGNQYQAMEIFDFMADEADLLDATKATAKPAIAWVRLSGWLPWMQMNSRSGGLVFNAMGQTIEGIDALPKVMRDEIAANYPVYVAPPPLDDKRPNETSWTYFKKQIDARRAAAPPSASKPAGH